MKMTSEEIRQRAKEIAFRSADVDQSEAAIIKLIEDATGEKIDEPFYESKALTGSVWFSDPFTIVVLDPDRATYLDTNYPKCSRVFRNGTRNGLIECLKANGYSYRGQYDFSKGLPK